jgi:hypothetical protein
LSPLLCLPISDILRSHKRDVARDFSSIAEGITELRHIENSARPGDVFADVLIQIMGGNVMQLFDRLPIKQ